LPDLHRLKNNQTSKVVRFDWTTQVLGVRLGDAMNAGGAALAQRNREREREEFRRLLYVAVTRAEDRLVLLGAGKHRKETFIDLLKADFEGHVKVRNVPYARPPFRPLPPVVEKHSPDWTSFVAR